MPEKLIPKIEKQDITAPIMQPGGTAIVLQRHERYERSRNAPNAGSLQPEAADAALHRDEAFFKDIVAQEIDGSETMVLFVSSDTQYAGNGRRSLETAQLAQNAAESVFQEAGVDPESRIINLSKSFKTKRHSPTDQDIRPMAHLREPQIFDTPAYVDHLRQKYGAEEGAGTGISTGAWAAHEMDSEKEIREETGAEGVYTMLDRTKQGISVLARYAAAFHEANPDKRLIIWATSHYDTISPLVKDATNTEFSEYLPVDYGAGVVMNIEPGSREVGLTAQAQRVVLPLGQRAINGARQ
jgi:hypothetical protein